MAVAVGERLDHRSLDVLFREARTYYKWLPRAVSDDTLRELYEVLKWAPTSANAAPARFAFIRSNEARARLRPALVGCEQEFFPEGHVRSNFLCNLGYGDPSSVHPRLPRLAFNEACSML